MTPIATIITNCTMNDRFVSWTGSNKTWLLAGKSVEVPFEVWSVGDKKQHDALIAELKAGLVSLSVRLLKPNGNYETIPFNPIATALPQAPVQLPPQQVEAKESPTASKTEETIHSNNHIVQAGDKEMSEIAKHFHLKAETIKQPGVAEVGEDIKDTVVFSNKALQENHIQEEAPAETLDKQAEVQEPERIQNLFDGDPEDVEDEAAEQGLTYEEFETKIDELLSAKNYEEAHKLLVGRYGEDKITFKASALRYTKTFEAVVKKYKLDE